MEDPVVKFARRKRLATPPCSTDTGVNMGVVDWVLGVEEGKRVYIPVYQHQMIRLPLRDWSNFYLFFFWD